jgi:hypothetical protein
MSGRDLGEIKIIAGWSRYKSEISLEEEEGKFGVELSSFSSGFSQMSRRFKSNIAGKHDNSVSQFRSRHKDGICE